MTNIKRIEADKTEADNQKAGLQKNIEAYLKTTPGSFDDKNLTRAKHLLMNKLSRELNDCHSIDDIYALLKHYRTYCEILLKQANINSNKFPNPSKQEAKTLALIVGEKLFSEIGAHGNGLGSLPGRVEEMLNEGMANIRNIAKNNGFHLTPGKNDKKNHLVSNPAQIELTVTVSPPAQIEPTVTVSPPEIKIKNSC